MENKAKTAFKNENDIAQDKKHSRQKLVSHLEMVKLLKKKTKVHLKILHRIRTHEKYRGEEIRGSQLQTEGVA